MSWSGNRYFHMNLIFINKKVLIGERFFADLQFIDIKFGFREIRIL